MAFDNQKDAVRLAMNLPTDQDVELHLPGGQILERSVIEQMLGAQVLADEEYGAGWPR
jgi:hypothetical protein